MPKQQEMIAVPGSKLLEAIGTVTVKWSALEFMIDNALFWASDPADTKTAEIMAGGATRTRWGTLKDILRRDHGTHPGTMGLIALIDGALSIKGERDRIVHGIYGDHKTSPSPDAALAIVLKRNKIRTEWSVDRPRIFATAAKIDALVANIMNHLMDHGERLGNSILPNAWRHKDRK
jgi:hypothetical protein